MTVQGQAAARHLVIKNGAGEKADVNGELYQQYCYTSQAGAAIKEASGKM